MKLMYYIWNSKWNLPRRSVSFIRRNIIKKFRLYEVSLEEQSRKMKEEGLDREKGIEKLNSILINLMDKNYDENDGMFSEHLILLASISIKYKPENILEIGTFDGRTALILSKLYPDSNIVTIDLPSHDKIFKSYYDRSNDVESFVSNRAKNIKGVKNIEFKEMNSIALVNFESKFDLIWIDGAHGYPVVAMDIINSYRIANNNGYILVDDIWIEPAESDKMYISEGGLGSLEILVNAGIIDKFTLFAKRLNGIYNYPGEKKYVALFRKNNLMKNINNY